MMTRFAATGPVRLGAGLILALLLVDVLSPSVARAGCGDPLPTVRVAASQAEPTPMPPAPREPCTGPHSSRPPDQPPLAPASVTVTLPDLQPRRVDARAHD